MPIIPRYEESQTLPGVGPNVRGSMEVAGMTGRALAGLGDTIVQTSDVFKKYDDAKKDTELSNYTIAATRDLSLKAQEHAQSADPNVDTFLKDADTIYQSYSTKITDDTVRSLFTRNYQKVQLEKELSVRSSQRTRLVEKSKATLDDGLNTLNHLYVNALTPEDKALVIEQGRKAIAGRVVSGVIGADDGVNLEQKFLSEIQVADAKADGMLNPGETAKKLLSGEYPDIEEGARYTLAERFQAQEDTELRRKIADEERADRKAEKALKDLQRVNDFNLVNMEFKQQLTPKILEDYASKQMISEEMYRWVRTRWETQEEVKDNEYVTGEIWSQIEQGRDPGEKTLLREAANGNISDKTYISMKRAVADKDYKEAVDSISWLKPSLLEYNPDKFLLYTESKERLDGLIEDGLTPKEAAKKVNIEYKDTIRRTARVIPKPSYLDGGKEDPDALEVAKQKTVQAFKAGEITQTEYELQIKRIDQLQEIAGTLESSRLSDDEKAQIERRAKSAK